MLKQYNLLLFASMAFLAISCADRKGDLNNLSDLPYFKILIPEDLKKAGWIPADSVFSSVEYISLETSKEVVLSPEGRLKIFVEADTLYILDLPASAIYCFAPDGRHLKTLSREGRGPGEYIRPCDLVVEKGMIFVLCDGPNQIVKYDSDLNYIGRISLPFDVTSFTKSHDLFFLHTRINRGEKYSVHVIDTNGAIISKYIPFQELAVANEQQCIWQHNGKAYAEFHNDYNVYELTREGYKVFATLDFGKDNLPEEAREWSNYTSDKTAEYVSQNNMRPPQGIDKVFVNDKYLIVQYASLSIRRSLIWNRESGEVFDEAISSTINYPVIQGGQFRWLLENRLYVLTTASKIHGTIKNGYGIFPTFLSSLNPEDNHVLAIYTLK